MCYTARELIDFGDYMKLALVGGRYYDDYALFITEIGSQSLYDINDVTEIVSGGAIGVDAMAKKLAKELGITYTVFKPDWKQFGRAAGPIRNKSIIEHADVVHAFWDGKSPGTKSSVGIANKLDKPLCITDIPSEEAYKLIKEQREEFKVYTAAPGFAKNDPRGKR